MVAKKTSLYEARHKVMIEFVYKILHDLLPPLKSDIFKCKSLTYDMRSSSILKQPSYKSITYGFKSLHYQGPMLWNKLPNDLKCAQNIYDFKRLLQNWNYNCICGTCFICTM